MPNIEFYNRYSGAIETEAIYGESYLRWVYESQLGKLALHAFLKRPFFSSWYGWRMSRPKSRRRILPFIKQYELDTGEFAEPVDEYATFNEFFYRRLKPDARPLSEIEDTVVFPADGRHIGFANVDNCEAIYAKGQRFSLEELLGDSVLASEFAGGSAIISRLCPVDYHRYHSPVDGTILSQRLINGSLYSVSPIALCRSIGYLWENKRVLTIIDAGKLGKVAFLALGATCVGSIKMTKEQESPVSRGDELGYFEFGGSCVISIFQKGKVCLSEDLAYYSSRQMELYAKVNDVAGAMDFE